MIWNRRELAVAQKKTLLSWKTRVANFVRIGTACRGGMRGKGESYWRSYNCKHTWVLWTKRLSIDSSSRCGGARRYCATKRNVDALGKWCLVSVAVIANRRRGSDLGFWMLGEIKFAEMQAVAFGWNWSIPQFEQWMRAKAGARLRADGGRCAQSLEKKWSEL